MDNSINHSRRIEPIGFSFQRQKSNLFRYCRYRGKKRKEYELGYEEGYEAGFDDGFADSDYDSEDEE